MAALAWKQYRQRKKAWDLNTLRHAGHMQNAWPRGDYDELGRLAGSEGGSVRAAATHVVCTEFEPLQLCQL